MRQLTAVWLILSFSGTNIQLVRPQQCPLAETLVEECWLPQNASHFPAKCSGEVVVLVDLGPSSVGVKNDVLGVTRRFLASLPLNFPAGLIFLGLPVGNATILNLTTSFGQLCDRLAYMECAASQNPPMAYNLTWALEAYRNSFVPVSSDDNVDRYLILISTMLSNDQTVIDDAVLLAKNISKDDATIAVLSLSRDKAADFSNFDDDFWEIFSSDEASTDIPVAKLQNFVCPALFDDPVTDDPNIYEETQCASIFEQLFLDIVVLVQVASGKPEKDRSRVRQVQAFLATMSMYVNISLDGKTRVRMGLIDYDSEIRLKSSLKTSSSLKFEEAAFEMTSTSNPGRDDEGLLEALKAGEAMFLDPKSGSRNESVFRKVFIIAAMNINPNSAAAEKLRRLQRDGFAVVTIAMDPDNELFVSSMATAGFAFSLKDHFTLVDDILESLAQFNCFCPDDATSDQFEVKTEARKDRYSSCVHSGPFPFEASIAWAVCNRTGFLVSLQSPLKQQFVVYKTRDTFGALSTGLWLGLQYEPATDDYYWHKSNQELVKANWTNWAPNEPVKDNKWVYAACPEGWKDALDCTWRTTNDNTLSLYTICEQRACDTENYAPCLNETKFLDDNHALSKTTIYLTLDPIVMIAFLISRFLSL